MPTYQLSENMAGDGECRYSLEGRDIAEAVEMLIVGAEARGIPVESGFLIDESGVSSGFVFAHIDSGLAVVQHEPLGDVYRLVRPQCPPPFLEPLPSLPRPMMDAITEATEDDHRGECRCVYCVAVHSKLARTPDANPLSIRRSIASFTKGLNDVPQALRVQQEKAHLCVLCGVPALLIGTLCDRHWANLAS